ncbi:MAG: YidC/Oxa1 family insertase periplasmic-domain containing protein [Phycisphaerae bacterium]
MDDTKRLIAAIVVAVLVMVGWQIMTYMIWGLPPKPRAGPDQTVQVAGSGRAEVILDGSGSQDPDSTPGSNDDIVSFEWYENYGQRNEKHLGSGPRVVVSLPPGFHNITLLVTDRKGRSAADEVLVTVEPTVAASGPTTAPARAAVQPSLQAEQPSQAAEQFGVVSARSVKTALIGADRPGSGYNLVLRLSSYDACLQAADVTTTTGKARPVYRYRRDVRTDRPYPLLRPVDPQTGEPTEYLQRLPLESAHASLVTSKLRLFRGSETFDVPLEQTVWDLRLERSENRHRAIFSTVITERSQPLLRLTKTMTLPRGRYDLKVTCEVENLSARPIKLSLTQLGPIGLKREDRRSDMRKAVTVAEEDGSVSVEKYSRSDVFKRNEPTRLGGDAGSSRLIYAALANKYFVCIMAPERSEQPERPLIDRAEAITATGRDQARGDLTVRWVTLPFELAPGGKRRIAFDLFLGPKLKELFDSKPLYRKRHYQAVISIEYACCFQGLAVVIVPLANVMLWMLKVLHHVLPNYGVAIIILVVIVRALLHPITKKGQVNMAKMQKNMARLQPKIEAIRQKYANDKQRLNQEMMRIYRQEGLNPVGQFMTCLPMGLQMPIWVALWTALNNTIELRHAAFALWIRDLASPDALIRLGEDSWIYQHSGWVPFIGPIDALNVLPLILGVSMYLQQRLTPKPATPGTKTPDQQKQQQMIMNFMSVFFAFLFYNMPSGLTLYIGASSLFGMLEQWRIRKHLKLQESAIAPAQAKPAAGKAGLWARLEKQVRQAQQVRSKRKSSRR